MKRFIKQITGAAGGGIAGFLVGALGGAIEGAQNGIVFGVVVGIISAATGGNFFAALFSTLIFCAMLWGSLGGLICLISGTAVGIQWGSDS